MTNEELLLNQLRRQNVFAPYGQPEQGQQIFQVPQIQLPETVTPNEVTLRQTRPFDPKEYGIEPYQAQTRGIDEMYQMLENMPQRQAPGILQKIGATVASLGGDPRLVDNALHGRYNQNMQDWQTRFDPVRQLAMEESRLNQAGRQAYQSQLVSARGLHGQELEWAKHEENVRRNQANEELARLKLSGDLIEGADGFVHYRDRATGRIENTGVSHLNMPAAQKLGLQLQSQQEVARIAATSRENVAQTGATSRENVQGLRNAGAIALEELRQKGRTADIQARGEQTRLNYYQRSRDQATLPENQRLALRTRAEHVMNVHPEFASNIQINNRDNTVSINPRWWGTLNDQDRQVIVDAIYGEESDTRPYFYTMTNPTETPTGRTTSTTSAGSLLGGTNTITGNDRTTPTNPVARPTGQSAGANPNKAGQEWNPNYPPVEGNFRTYPNGRRARWDGLGWELIEE